jgi:ABC-type transport system involved in multi-copper enzyme maturation permease subunit
MKTALVIGVNILCIVISLILFILGLVMVADGLESTQVVAFAIYDLGEVLAGIAFIGLGFFGLLYELHLANSGKNRG